MDLSSHHWHFIGIGGAGMSALASALLDLGARVSGSDLTASEATRELERRGARVYVGHDPASLDHADRVVYTPAVPSDNPELAEARRRGLVLVKRAELLGTLMDLRRGVAVAGTHGKTTTSAMIAWALVRAGRDPSYMVGAPIRGLGAGGHWGTGEALVAEADEYDRSFLHLHPDIAVITNIESDHLEYYGSEQAIFEAFRQFALNIRPGGLLVLCADDPSALALHNELAGQGVPFRIQLYGHHPTAMWRPRQVRLGEHGGMDYVALRDGVQVASVSLRVPGEHNVLNSLAALAACVELGMPAAEVARLLGEYAGAARRFELKGVVRGVTVLDDYAHHPTEIVATLRAARLRYPGKRIVVLFQPHTYTRTRDFLDAFASALGTADRVIVTEIYASRERDTLGMSGRHIVERMQSNVRTGRGVDAAFAPTLEEAARMLVDRVASGDIVLVMGAGDVWKAADMVLEALNGPDGSGGSEQRKGAVEVEAGGRRAQSSLHIPQDMQDVRDMRDVQDAAGNPPAPASSPTGSPSAPPATDLDPPSSGRVSAGVRFKPDIAAMLEEATGLKVMRDEPMSKHNSLRIGGPAGLFVAVNTTQQLVAAVLFARRHGIPYLVLGNGTNVLVSDYGINGLVVHNRTQHISQEPLDADTSLWHVDSGVLFSRLARITCEAGWTGQEWASSVPGSVGGGVVSNAGAHGKELKDDLVYVTVLTAEGNIERWPVESLQMGYRTSRFKAHGYRAMSPPEVVLGAGIRLYRDTEHRCEAIMRRFLEERQAKQPQGKSAGSTFKNPPGTSAGYLIEQVGLKGFRHGQAQFSPKHANFMMNLGGATAAEVMYLMDLARLRVKEQFGIEMEPEIEFVGDF